MLTKTANPKLKQWKSAVKAGDSVYTQH